MTSTAPADQDIRDRLRDDLDTSFFLEAGAGAGKTRVLVDRVVELIRRRRAPLDRIAAVTFTEKAAAELRDRIRRQLQLAARDSDQPADAAHLTDAARQVDSAPIGTIHAFAANLLRERALEAGIDPAFRVLDQLQTDLRFQQSWSRWLWSRADPDAQAAIADAVDLGLDLADLEAAAQRLSQNRDLDIPTDDAPPTDPHDTVRQWRAQLGDIRELARRIDPDLNAPAANRARAYARDASILLDQLRELSDSADVDPPDLARRLTNLRVPQHRQQNPPPELAAIAHAWRHFADSYDRFAADRRDGALNRIVAALTPFLRDDADGRKRDGILSYDDLLLEARDLLVRQPDVRAAFRAHFRVILVDEFQDTDPLQAEIVLLLASRDDTADWREALPAPGKLFLVGDPKQSIYRFRRADIDIYEQVRDLFRRAADQHPGSADQARLSVNFRSRPDLIRWHDAVFSHLLAPDPAYPSAQAVWAATQPERDEPGPAVVALAPPRGTDFQRIDEARRAEADLVANLISGLVELDPAQSPFGRIFRDGEPCPPQLRDIAILVRTRTGIRRYTDALDRAGIPYHFDSGQGFYRRPEIRDFAHLLMALADPSDLLALVATLKSPLAGASDRELLAWAQTGQPDAYDGPLREPLQRLRDLRERVIDLPLPQLVDAALRESGLLHAQFLNPGAARDRAASLQALVQRAQDFADGAADPASDSRSLAPFVRWLSQRRAQNLPEAESATSEAVDDVVRILTIHQAKGLEFPVVILPKLADGQSRANEFIIDRPNGRIDFKIGRAGRGDRGDRVSFATQGYAAAEARELAYADAEARRMLYVAATRARDWLFISAYKSATAAANTFYDFLRETRHLWPRDAVVARRADQFDAVRARPATPSPVAHAEIERQWRERRDDALHQGDLPLHATTPSQLSHDDPKQELESLLSEVDEDGQDTDAVRRGMTIGSAIHDALAAAVFDDPDESRRRAARICAEHAIPIDTVWPHIERAIASPLIARARSARRLHREIPLVTHDGAQVGARIMEGIADLAFEEPDGWIIVDYKSDAHTPADRLSAYELQVRAYTQMLTAAGANVKEAWLLFTASGDQHRVSLDEY